MRANLVLFVAALGLLCACSMDASQAAVNGQEPSGDSSAGDALRPVELTSASLHGTEPDGAVGWNRDGSVRVDRALRRRFDYLLSTLGEATLSQVRGSLKADLKPVAPAASVASTLALFDTYTSYLRAVDQLRPLATEDRLQALHALRVKVLSAPVAQALFEDEEQVDAAAVASRAILARSDLSEQQRADALAAGLSADARSTQDLLVEVKRITDQTAAFDASGASAAHRLAVREARLGAAAAQGLADLDAAHARWSARIAAFRVQRDAIEANPTLDAAARGRALDAVLSRDFSLPESRRVRALELAPR